jgi:hypothetical protein
MSLLGGRDGLPNCMDRWLGRVAAERREANSERGDPDQLGQRASPAQAQLQRSRLVGHHEVDAGRQAQQILIISAGKSSCWPSRSGSVPVPCHQHTCSLLLAATLRHA